MNLLDFATIVSYVALNVDLLLEIAKIRKNKSSRDVSLPGLSIRYAAVLIIFIKFASLSDVPLIIGQGCIALSMTLYLIFVFKYAKRRIP